MLSGLNNDIKLLQPFTRVIIYKVTATLLLTVMIYNSIATHEPFEFALLWLLERRYYACCSSKLNNFERSFSRYYSLLRVRIVTPYFALLCLKH